MANKAQQTDADLLAKPFAELQKDFNAAADKWAADDHPIELILTRYDLLMRHKVENDDQKRALSHTLFHATVASMKTVVDLPADNNLNGEFGAYVTRALDPLLTDEGHRFVPPNAARDLMNVSMMVLDHTEKSKRSNSNKTIFADFARKAMEYGEKFAAVQAQDNPEVGTTKDIATVKRISLKPSDPGNA